MCLIVFSWQVISNHPFIAASNRDEYYSRPTAPAGWWQDHPTVFAPRDLQAQGTWIGAAKLAYAGHKFAALTNVRNGSTTMEQAPSRGKLVSDYLTGSWNAETICNTLRLVPINTTVLIYWSVNSVKSDRSCTGTPIEIPITLKMADRWNRGFTACPTVRWIHPGPRSARPRPS